MPLTKTSSHLPVCIINFKAYESAVGKKAVHLARIIAQEGKRAGVTVAVAVQAADIAAVAHAVRIPVLAQHIDAVQYGAHTGSVLAEGIVEAGAVGTLINHAERQVSLKTIAATIRRCQETELVSIICANTPLAATLIAKLKPDLIAIEPPALIGGTVSVSQAKPEVITKSVAGAAGVPVLCGAGVHTTEDVQKALALGARGILVASGVTNARNPRLAVRELLKGFDENS